MSAADVTVSILIVNWNSKDLLRECLVSIRDTCAELSPQIVVVDGGSFDGCAEMLSSDFPDVEFVQSRHNVGFGRANNLGLARVTGDAVWVLNPDTLVRPGALQTLLGEIRRRPDAAIVSPKLLNTDFTPQSSVHALPRPICQALDSDLLRRLLSPLNLWAPPGDFAPPETVAVEAIAGTAMLMWTAVLRRVGGFTPAYFMYAEDMDLSSKVRREGLRIYYVPAAEIVHHGGASSSVQGSTFSAVMMRDALHTYFVLNKGSASAATYRVAVGAVAIMRLLVLLPGLALGTEKPRSVRRALFARSRAALSWSCGGQRWTKRYALDELLTREALDDGPMAGSTTGR